MHLEEGSIELHSIQYNVLVLTSPVEAEGPRGSAESGKETCLYFKFICLTLLLFLFCLGWHLIIEINLFNLSAVIFVQC
ncbi:hypothetical protein PVAP13_8NG138100 [Panicum virgatum]|uniref:Uncharacterized protein n=1 Tax=Panicum virgatum TaxID=38727 RepID=A0A8T0PG45_PANVG|nr:hypothetical protein PVAP13_8NG138100 [Panicum virgatum]